MPANRRMKNRNRMLVINAGIWGYSAFCTGQGSQCLNTVAKG